MSFNCLHGKLLRNPATQLHEKFGHFASFIWQIAKQGANLFCAWAGLGASSLDADGFQSSKLAADTKPHLGAS
jgi:hypothetical protein